MRITDVGPLLPFLISLVGVVADYLTTCIGLSRGFYETHPLYQPTYALLIFWGALAFLTLTLPKGRLWGMSKNAIASTAFLGSVNNTLVLLGLFSGLHL